MHTAHRPTRTRLALIALGAGIATAAFPIVGNAIQLAPPAEEPAAEEAATERDAGMNGEYDEATILSGLDAFKEGGCRACHGWAANGDREGPTPQGPSLRETLLNYDGLVYTVTCGRLGSEMPYFLRNAYRDDEHCGLDAEAAGDMIPPRSQSLLDEEEIADLAAYIDGYVKGRGEITFEECEFYFGEGASRCEFYRE